MKQYQKQLSKFMSEDCTKYFEYAITLTVKNLKVGSYYSVKNGKTITSDKVKRIANMFVHKLNRLMLKNGYRRNEKAFNSLIKVEPNKKEDNKHIHIALGNVKHNRLELLLAIQNVMKRMKELDEEHTIEDIYDSGWLNYMSKKQFDDSDNVLFETSVMQDCTYSKKNAY